ncbi:MAG TPA: hypothetical protein DEF34_11240 [Desulfotomaculum sp.]|nr:MAG: hypothetical protein JL56_14350 [Desulfotomaculum sp. BICA1-6]HBX24187.1 hypothetical protein [Desulfotomaculum sp.]
MLLRDAVSLFEKTRSPDILRWIRSKHGMKGFSIACRAAGIKRGQGKEILGIYSDVGAIEKIATKACGMRTNIY